ncbi:MAG TPA: AI-2E family transporter [Motilibacteraceae bacterium]|nr:AI-2E family transporter [Motilibacteraceae bacterium]
MPDVQREPAGQRAQHRRRLAPPRSFAGQVLADGAIWAARLLVLLVAAWALLQVARTLGLLVLSAAAAVLLTALAHPIAAALRRAGLPRSLAATVTVLGGAGAIVLAMWWVVTQVVDQSSQIIASASDAVGSLPVSTPSLASLQDKVVGFLESHQGSITSSALTGLRYAAETGTGLVLTVFITFYLLYDGERLWDRATHLAPAGRRETTAIAGRHAWVRLAGWVRGTFLIAVFHGIVVALTLFLLGVPLVAPLALLVFLGSFIPIVGALLFGGLAVLVAFATQGVAAAVILFAVLVVDNQIEAHVLQPFLVGRYVKLHPLAVVASITAGELLVGLPGAILAVPLVAAVFAVLAHLAEERRAGEVAAAEGDGPPPAADEDSDQVRTATPDVVDVRESADVSDRASEGDGPVAARTVGRVRRRVDRG